MIDKELLELAAKAAGIDLSFNIMLNGGDTPYITDSYISAYEYDEWNPLTDDGDALRLAVILRLWIQTSERCAWAQQDAESILGEAAASSMVMLSDVGNDPYAAVRRAIVRAAAEIGKGMR